MSPPPEPADGCEEEGMLEFRVGQPREMKISMAKFDENWDIAFGKRMEDRSSQRQSLSDEAVLAQAEKQLPEPEHYHGE
jgi:hypothetical protein